MRGHDSSAEVDQRVRDDLLSRAGQALQELVVVEERLLLLLREGVAGAWEIAGRMQRDVDELKWRIEVVERLTTQLQLTALIE